MSEVKVHRYDVNLCPDRQCDCGASFATEECPDSNGDYVRYVDHEKELAALREELAERNRKFEIVCADADEYLNRLTAAEQRNAGMLNWLRRQANAEKDPTVRATFIEAHNALKQIAKEVRNDAV